MNRHKIIAASLFIIGILSFSLRWYIVVPTAVYAQTSKWSTPLNLSKTQTKSWLPSACADRAGNVHVVWAEFANSNSSTSDTVYYAMWDGRQWSKPSAILVTGAEPASLARNAVWHPGCATDDVGRLHVVWTDTHSVYYSQAYIGDETWTAGVWSPPRAIFPNPGAPGGFPAITVDNQQTVHVTLNTLEQIYYLSSRDGGKSWSKPISIADTPNRATRPRILADNQGFLHVGISEVNESDNGIGVLYARSLDNGQTWDVTRRLSDGTKGRYPIWLTIGIDGQGVLHAVWPAAQDFVFYHRWSNTKGASWSEPKVIAQGKAGYGWPSMAIDGDGILHLLVSVSDDIYHYQWNGTNWIQTENVSRTSSSSNKPTLLVTGGNQLHAIWMEYAPGYTDVHNSGNAEIYYSTTTISASAKPLATFLPRPPTATVVPTATRAGIAQPTARATSVRLPISSESAPDLQSGQTVPLLAGILPIMFLLGLVLLWRARERR